MIFQILDSLVEQCESRHQSKTVTKENVLVALFEDGDITEVQDILTGVGSYMTCDKHGGYDRYWGGHDDACVLFSFHEPDGNLKSPYISMHFFDDEQTALKVSQGYFGHHFIALTKLSQAESKGDIRILADNIGISEALNKVSWREIVEYLARFENLNILIAKTLHVRGEHEEYEHLKAS